MSPAIGTPGTGDAGAWRMDGGDTDRFAVYRAWVCDPCAEAHKNKAAAKARTNPRTVTDTQHHDGETACIPGGGCMSAERARPNPTAAVTIEALLHELRSGLSCLADPGALDRLWRCDEAAMRTIARELLSWKSKNKPWLPAWSREDVANLLRVRRGLK
jgi:hypothetical protein